MNEEDKLKNNKNKSKTSLSLKSKKQKKAIINTHNKYEKFTFNN